MSFVNLFYLWSSRLFLVFNFYPYQFRKFLCLLSEPFWDRCLVDEQLSSTITGTLFIPHGPGSRTLDFKVSGMSVRIWFSEETNRPHIYEIACLPVGESGRTAMFSPRISWGVWEPGRCSLFRFCSFPMVCCDCRCSPAICILCVPSLLHWIRQCQDVFGKPFSPACYGCAE